MNRNPRNTVIALVAATSLVFGSSACGQTGGSRTPDPAATTELPDCDLGDLREGDKDCDNPRAYRDAVKNYGKKRVEKAEAEYAEKTRKRPQRSAPRTRETTATQAPRPQATTRTGGALNRNNSTKSSRTGGLFGTRNKRR